MRRFRRELGGGCGDVERVVLFGERLHRDAISVERVFDERLTQRSRERGDAARLDVGDARDARGSMRCFTTFSIAFSSDARAAARA